MKKTIGRDSKASFYQGDIGHVIEENFYKMVPSYVAHVKEVAKENAPSIE